MIQFKMRKNEHKIHLGRAACSPSGSHHCTSPTQQVHYLDLESSIAIAKLKSFDMLSLKEDLNIAEFNLKSATSRFKTHVDLDLTLPNYSKQISSYTDSEGNISLYTSRKGTYNGEITISQPYQPTVGFTLRRDSTTSTTTFGKPDNDHEHAHWVVTTSKCILLQRHPFGPQNEPS